MVAHINVNDGGVPHRDASEVPPRPEHEARYDEQGYLLPHSVVLNGKPAFAPNEMAMMKAQSGLTLDQIMSDPITSVQSQVWVALRDLGYHPRWDDAAFVKGELIPEVADPTTGGV